MLLFLLVSVITICLLSLLGLWFYIRQQKKQKEEALAAQHRREKYLNLLAFTERMGVKQGTARPLPTYLRPVPSARSQAKDDDHRYGFTASIPDPDIYASVAASIYRGGGGESGGGGASASWESNSGLSNDGGSGASDTGSSGSDSSSSSGNSDGN